MEKSHFEQAKCWLVGAKHIASLEKNNSDTYSVAVAMLIHAILKANDTLTQKFLEKTPQKHDDARKFFDEMIKKGLISATYSQYSQTIQEAVEDKRDAEYKITYFSKSDYEDLERKAEKFIKMVEGIIK